MSEQTVATALNLANLHVCADCSEELVERAGESCRSCAQLNEELETKRRASVEAQAEELRNEGRRAALFSERRANMDRSAYMRGRGENFDAEYALYCPEECGGEAVKMPVHVTASMWVVGTTFVLAAAGLLIGVFRVCGWLVVTLAGWMGR